MPALITFPNNFKNSLKMKANQEYEKQGLHPKPKEIS
jgi:hypothetical protein